MKKSCPWLSSADMVHTQYIILIFGISKARTSNLQAAPVPALELSS